MGNSKTIDTPISTTTHLEMDKPGSHVNKTMYRGIIGSLVYLTVCKPDRDNFDLVGYVDADHVGYLIKQQLEDLGVFTDCTPLLCDNTSAINIAKNPVQHKESKHIGIEFVLDEEKLGEILTDLIDGSACSDRRNVADNMLIIGLIRRETCDESASQGEYQFWEPVVISSLGLVLRGNMVDSQGEQCRDLAATLYRLAAVQQHSSSLLRPN
uniref:Uncharacterized protein LOC104234045 n=1 Tax=Nicotiana sylvestris TaxID=4096 RepID=A0A1U7XH87_NICSY|nr:PREDICTED: uncharacterized protein LOC104234045 [Nicotiana sylvestris]